MHTPPSTNMQTCFATCPKQLESLLAQELLQLGIAHVRERRAGVEFQADIGQAYRACIQSRLANHILWPLLHFECQHIDDLYRAARAFEWSDHMRVEQTFAIRVTQIHSVLTHTHYATQRFKDAIVDYWLAQTNDRPNVQLEQPDVLFHLHVEDQQACIYFDLAGDSLHRRGYRQQQGIAPLKENLGAAILLRAGWPTIAVNGGDFIDPMCGSGTLLIEAVLMAKHHAPGLLREYFALKGWRQFDAKIWQAEWETAQKQILPSIPNVFIGADSDASVLNKAAHNIKQAGLEEYIQLQEKDMLSIAPTANPGLIICNPPYGERLGDSLELFFTYSALAEHIRTHFFNWQLSVLTGNEELSKAIALDPDKSYSFYNGDLKCRLFNYKIYSLNKEAPELADLDISHAQNKNLLQRFIQRVPGAQDFYNRLAKNARALVKWHTTHKISCYRLYDADLPDFAFAIDVYRTESLPEKIYFHVQEYAPPKTIDPMKALLRSYACIATIAEQWQVPLQQISLKLRQRQKGSQQYEKQNQLKHTFIVREEKARFYVNLFDYLDTGIFFDTANLRKYIAQKIGGKSFLNLFCYTATASVQAALADAQITLSIDLSKTYLNWAEENFLLNCLNVQQATKFTDPNSLKKYFQTPSSKNQHNILMHADCLDWLEHNQLLFDVILLDPPSFSNSKRMDGILDIQRDHAELITQAMRCLSANGELIFVTNKQKFKLDAALSEKYKIENVSKQLLRQDFARYQPPHQAFVIRQS